MPCRLHSLSCLPVLLPVQHLTLEGMYDSMCGLILHKPTVAAVEKVLPILKKKGYEVCTVSELLEAKGVKAGKGDKVFSATDIIRK